MNKKCPPKTLKRLLQKLTVGVGAIAPQPSTTPWGLEQPAPLQQTNVTSRDLHSCPPPPYKSEVKEEGNLY